MYNNFTLLKAEDHINNTYHLSVEFREASKVSSAEIHWHNYFTIDIVIEGAAIHNLNGNEYLLTKGDITLIKPTDIHSVCPQNYFRTITFLFADDVFENKYRYLTKFRTVSYKLSDEELKQAILYSKTIKNALLQIEKTPENALLLEEIKLNFNLILILIAKRVKTTQTVDYDNITKTVEYLNTHFRERFSQKEIAKMVNLSPSYFCNWFKREVGVSYTEYLLSLRLEYARSLLKKGFSVIDSCYASGFSTLSHFSRSFKSKFSKSPSEYRKKS